MRGFQVLILIFLVSSCGGGNETSNNNNTVPPKLEIELSESKSYTNNSITISWSSSNTSSCNASNAWNGKKSTSGAEVINFVSDGKYKFELSCTGPNSNIEKYVTIQVFEYDKILNISNILLDGDAAVISIKGDPLGGSIPPSGVDYSRLRFNNFEITDSLDDNLEIQVFQESPGYFDFSLDGININGDTLYNFDFSFNERGNIFPKDVDYINSENSKFLPLVHITEWYTNAVLETLKLDSYNNSQSTEPKVEYVDASLIEFSFYDDYRLISSSYGNKTFPDDIPLEGIKKYSFFSTGYLFNSLVTHDGVRTWGFNNYYARVGDYQDVLVAFGNGNISFDFTNNTIYKTPESKLSFSTFQHLPTLREGKREDDKGNLFFIQDNAKLVPDHVFILEDGLIIGNSFSANIIKISPSGSTHIGKMFGSFYGPNAKNIGVNIYFDETTTLNDYSILMAIGVGSQ